MAWNAPGGGQGGGNQQDPWQRHQGEKAFNPDALAGLLRKLFEGQGGGGQGSSGSAGGSAARHGRMGLYLVLLVLLGVYVFMGFYTVREAERGVLLRFGKVYDVVDPGLRWKLTGIDTVTQVDIEQVKVIQTSGTMLTEDENVVLVEMSIQYRVSDPVKYLYSVAGADQSLMDATDSALRYVIGHTMMDDILTSGREMVRQKTRDLLASIIAPYDMGLSIVDVNFLPARAPDQVKAAFDDAIAAQEDEQRYKREAEAYANEVLPRADGKVQRIRQEAEGYRSQVVLKAQGEVARFEQVLPEYNAAPDITKRRIYLDTMQEVLGKAQKVILDTPAGSTPVLYMPLPQGAAAAPRGAPPPEANLPMEGGIETLPGSETVGNGKAGRIH
ncbi:MAG: FtsH protease activity modulator HflK [Succinivibrionaceae bacterium]|nr:FtsH protease activity modulator HflK [Succinivibrionaceae bacterium]